MIVLLLATAPLLAAAAATPAGALISVTPAPPPPGWGPVTVADPQAPSYLAGLAASPDGSFKIAGSFDVNYNTFTYNTTVYTHAFDHWTPARIWTDAGYTNWVSVAATGDADRAGVVSMLAAPPAGVRQAYVSFVHRGGGHDAPLLVSDSPSPSSVQLAATRWGDTMVVWYDSSSDQLFANHSAAASPFEGSQVIFESNGTLSQFRVAPLGNDSFLALWVTNGANGSGVTSRLYTAAGGWGPETPVLQGVSGLQTFALGSSDLAGRAAFAWWQQGTQLNLSLQAFDAMGTGWSNPVRVDNLTTIDHRVLTPSVAVDGTGAAHVFWGTGLLVSDMRDLSYCLWIPDGTPTRANLGTVRAPASLGASASDDGFVALTWSEDQFQHTLARVHRFVPGSGWRPVEALDTSFSAGHSLWSPFGAVSERGNYSAVWVNYETDGATLLTRDFVAGNDPPAITVDAPAEGSHAGEPTVLVTGAVSGNSTVDVAGAQAAVATDGSFSVRVALEPGLNTLRVHALDEWNNPADAWVNVTFDDPVPALEEDIAAAQSDLAQTQQELAGAQAALGATTDRVKSAESNNSDLARRVSDADARADDMQAQLDVADTQLAATADQNAALAGQAATATLVAFIGLFAGVAGIGVSLMMARRGAGAAVTAVSGGSPPAAKVGQPKASSGGADAEEADDSSTDTPEELRHRDA